MNNEQSTKPQHLEEDEIDLIALAKTVWNGRKTVIKITVIFIAIGLFIAVFTQKEYTASTTMVPQASSGVKIGGNLGGLAAMAGINLGSSGGESGISPSLYPQIINSIPFQKELLQTPLTIRGQSEPISFVKYYTEIYRPGLLGYLKKYTIGLPGVIIKAIKGKSDILSVDTERSVSGIEDKNQILTIGEKEKELISILENQILLSVNEKDGYLSLSASMPEALPSAELTKAAQILLQQYIIKFKVKKSSDQLRFIQERYNEKEKEFKTAQQKLARFQDRNQFVNSAIAQTTLTRLQSEYDLAYGVYAELAKQIETQQIQVKEDTPVFTILKPVSVPIEKTKPNKVKIIMTWIFFGLILGVLKVFSKYFVSTIEEKWKN